MDFLDSAGKPVRRPYMDGALTMQMPADYDDYYDEFVVHLWSVERRFTLQLNHEDDYELDELRREALTVGISRCEQDEFLDAYYPLFGSLEHFVREIDAERCSEPPPRWAVGRLG